MTFPSREQNSHNLYLNSENISNVFPSSIRDGVDLISLLLSAKDGKLPHTHPKQIKDDLAKYIKLPSSLEGVNITRQGQLILTTKNVQTAQEVLNISSLLDVPVSANIQTETITTRFLLRLDSSVTCTDIADELTEQGFSVLEVRRFVRNSAGTPLPTSSVLVTCFGTSLPPEVKLWYQLHKINLFFDKPRPCLTCFRFNHSTRSCRSDKVCASCATTHTGECASPTLLCINCKGAHSATSKSCPTYLREVRLQRFRSKNHLTIREARRQFKDSQDSSKVQYATVAARAPSDNVKSADFQAALQNMSQQFNCLLQSAVAEFQQSLHTIIENITKPLLIIVQELQKKNTK